MNAGQVARLLTLAAAVDNRNLEGEAGDAAVAAWLQAIGDLVLDECVEALGIHRRSAPGVYLEPGHIAELVLDVVRPEQRRLEIEAEQFEADVRMVEAMGGTRAQWQRASDLGPGHEQQLIETLTAARKAVEA